MAESKQREVVPSLAEVNDEQAAHGNITKEATEKEIQISVGSEEGDAEKVDQKPAAEESAPYSEINSETPEQEVQEKQEVEESHKAEDGLAAKEYIGATELVTESTQLEVKQETNENTPTIENSGNFDQQEGQMEAVEDAQEDIEGTPTIKLETAPADFRFPTTNQTRHCFTRYIEYHRCIAAKGDAADCQKYARYYRSLCPDEWIERWNEQRANGTFPGPL
ncbi:hypothetical protein HPP92_016174 [Vanilla planifolia]|uniref:Cytochrome c oxidase subunit 6b-1 n=1 Tax=Vanilla planifolia TaxID=51239 RepID=A0A835QHL3_VANPL|nr:hypothetical protein HPP92_016174 [Vanilla planifolia]